MPRMCQVRDIFIFCCYTGLGGRIEYLTFRIFGSDHLPEKERLVAVVADVYNYNGEYLEEAVGMIDEIYF